jgi:hypothetical protein
MVDQHATGDLQQRIAPKEGAEQQSKLRRAQAELFESAEPATERLTRSK